MLSWLSTGVLLCRIRSFQRASSHRIFRSRIIHPPVVSSDRLRIAGFLCLISYVVIIIHHSPSSSAHGQPHPSDSAPSSIQSSSTSPVKKSAAFCGNLSPEESRKDRDAKHARGHDLDSARSSGWHGSGDPRQRPEPFVSEDVGRGWFVTRPARSSGWHKIPPIMYESYDDPINILVEFVGNCVQPREFVWSNRLYTVDQVNLVHTTQEGEKCYIFFSVSNATNMFKLRFDPSALEWRLMELYCAGA